VGPTRRSAAAPLSQYRERRLNRVEDARTDSGAGLRLAGSACKHGSGKDLRNTTGFELGRFGGLD
jgi:hypothetical protein